MLEKNAVLYGLLIQILASVFLLVISVLIGYNNFQNVALAIGLFISIGIWIFLFEYLLVREIRMVETRAAYAARQSSYTFLTNLLFRDRVVSSNQVLTLKETLAIEAQADEVWIYAYDLRWENNSTHIPDVVLANLKRGVHYRYIVPPQIKLRVDDLRAKYSSIPDCDDIIKFRARREEVKLVQFGIALINPFLMKRGDREVDNCVAIFYPRFSATALQSPEFDHYLCYRGATTIELQEAFLQLWDNETAPMT